MVTISFDLPETEEQLDNFLKKIDALRNNKDFAKALAMSQHLILHDPAKLAGYRKRVDIWSDLSEHDLALADLKILADENSIEPDDYHNLGIALLRTTEVEEAVVAFTKSITLGEKHDFHYYDSSCRFHRAAALLSLGKAREALHDCDQIDDGYQCFLPSEGVKTKEDLIAQAQKMIMAIE